MRLNLAAKFAVQDVRPVPDPFGVGITFHIKRIGVREYTDYLQSRSLSSPLYQAALRASMKTQIVGVKDEEARARMMADEVDKIDFSKVDLRTLADVEGVARHLIADIEGLTDEDNGGGAVVYTPEVGIDLLGSTVPISEPIMVDGEEVSPIGAALGPALKDWIVTEAAKSEKYRGEFMEDASGN